MAVKQKHLVKKYV